MKFQKYALNILRQHKYRITKTRLAVLKIIEKSKKPLNAYDISKIAKKEKINIDTTTIYRILEVFTKHKIVHFNKGSQGYIACHNFNCTHAKHSHHQLTCTQCGTIEEIHNDDTQFIASIQKKQPTFEITSHYLELSGLCPKCKT